MHPRSGSPCPILHYLAESHLPSYKDSRKTATRTAPGAGQVKALYGSPVIDSLNVCIFHGLLKSINGPFGIASKAPVREGCRCLFDLQHGREPWNHCFNPVQEGVSPSLLFPIVRFFTASPVIGFESSPRFISSGSLPWPRHSITQRPWRGVGHENPIMKPRCFEGRDL